MAFVAMPSSNQEEQTVDNWKHATHFMPEDSKDAMDRFAIRDVRESQLFRDG